MDKFELIDDTIPTAVDDSPNYAGMENMQY